MEDNSKHSRSLFHNGNLQLIFLITLMAVMGVASITPALPNISKAFDISAEKTGLLIAVFTLPGIVLTPLLGILADRYSRKTILVPSLFLFALAGSSCFFMHDYKLLLVFRFLQGMGAASLGSLNATLIADIFHGKERGEAFGYNASVLSIGTAMYPAIGGALAVFGWNFPFILPILALPIGLLVIFRLKNPEPDSKQNIRKYLNNAFKFILAGKAIILFLLSIFTFIILYGSMLTYYPFLMEKKFGSSALIIGLTLSAMSFSTAFTSFRSGRLLNRFKPAYLLFTSYCAYAISMFIMPYITQLWFIFIPVIIFGIGNGLNMPVLQNMLASLVPIEYRGFFMSINGMVLRLGQTLGPVIMGFVYKTYGLSLTFLASVMVALIMLILVLLIQSDHYKKD